MENVTEFYSEVLPDGQHYLAEGGMQVYINVTDQDILSLAPTEAERQNILTLNGSLTGTILIPVANEGYRWIIHSQYSATLESINGGALPPVETQEEEPSPVIEVRESSVQAEPDTNFRDRQETPFDQDYVIRTVDDALIQLWIRECGGTVDNYSREAGEDCFRNYYADAISRGFDRNWSGSTLTEYMAIPGMASVIANSERADLLELDLNEVGDEIKGVLDLSLETILAGLGDLSLEEIANLYMATQAPVLNREGVSSFFVEENSYIDALQNAFVWEAGGIGDLRGFQENLATEDWLNANPDYLDNDHIFSQIADLILYATHMGIRFPRFAYPESALYEDIAIRQYYFTYENAESILSQYIQQQDQFTDEDLLQLGFDLSNEFSELSANFQYGTSYLERDNELSADNVAGDFREYEDRIALDNLRATIFDPAWNPAIEMRDLTTLRSLIAEMPTQILGVDVAFAKSGMEEYAGIIQRRVDWHNEMRVQLALIDEQMILRQEQGIPWESLWWLSELALILLFEPYDWLVTIRDISSGLFYGDLRWWDFLGFLPIITNNLDDILRLMARSDVDELVEAGIDASRRIDVFADGASESRRPRGVKFTDDDSYGSYPGYRTAQIQDLQERANDAGFTLSIDHNADDFLDNKKWNAGISVNPDNTVTIHLRSDATKFEWFHERAHALQLFELGYEEYARLGSWKRELHVYNEIIRHASRNNPAGSPIFNRAELQGAWNTLRNYWIQTSSYLGGIEMPTNPFPLNRPANVRYESGKFIDYD